MKALKRKRTWSQSHSTHGSRPKAKVKKARLDPRPEESESDNEDITEPAVRLPGVIEKLGITNQGRPAGLVSFCLKTGKKHLGMFLEEDSVTNGFCLKTMREYTSNHSLGFPFEVGKHVQVIRYSRTPSCKYNVTHKVRIEVGGYSIHGEPIPLEDLSGKDVPNLNGSEFVGVVKAFDKQTGVASFSVNDTSVLTHFNLFDVTLGGLQIPKLTYHHVLYVGMQLSLKVTSSSSKNIPGIHYTADAEVDVPLCLGVGNANDETDEVRGVIVKMTDGELPIISCSCKGNEAEKFYVICENVMTDHGPISQSDLHFAEGTNVLCSLYFKSNYGNVVPGSVYQANVTLPLKRGNIIELMDVEGAVYPHKLLTGIDNKETQVTIERKHLKVNGKVPRPNFPKNFFKRNMAVHLNDVWKTNASETHATLDISTNVLIRQNATKEAESPTMESDMPSLGAMDTDDRIKPKRAPPIDGVIAATRENDEGLVLPSEVNAVIDNVSHRVCVPSSQVMVNSKPNCYLPPSYASVGDAVKLYNIKVCKDTNTYSATINYFFPKNELKRASDKYKQKHTQGPATQHVNML